MKRLVLLLASMALTVIFGSGVALTDSPTTKEDCKNDGYAKYGFKNQGQCIRAVNAASPPVVPPPEITLTQAPEWRSVINQDSVTIGWTSNIDQPDYRCDFRMSTPIGVETNWIDNNVPCSSPRTYTGLEDGGYNFTVKAIDSSGNAIATKDVQFIVDTHPPETTIDEAYKAANDPWAITFTATSSEWFSNFQCRVFKANEEPPTHWDICDKTITPASFIPSPIEDGNYFLQVRAVDMAQTADPTPIQALFSIDRLAPTIEFTGGPSEGERLSSNDVSISWQSTDSGPSGIRHDLGCLIRITGPGGHEGVGDCKVNSPAEYTDLPDGDYRFSVSTEDRAGNRSEVIERNFTVDTTP